MFHVIVCTEDGDHYLESLSEAELLIRLKEEYWGQDVTILKDAPSSLDLQKFSGIIIFRGPLVAPQPKQQTIAWMIPE